MKIPPFVGLFVYSSQHIVEQLFVDWVMNDITYNIIGWGAGFAIGLSIGVSLNNIVFGIVVGVAIGAGLAITQNE